MEEYVKLYDECIYNMHSEEADRLAREQAELELIQDMYEEYMWYKHEDYMLYKKLLKIDIVYENLHSNPLL